MPLPHLIRKQDYFFESLQLPKQYGILFRKLDVFLHTDGEAGSKIPYCGESVPMDEDRLQKIEYLDDEESANSLGSAAEIFVKSVY